MNKILNFQNFQKIPPPPGTPGRGPIFAKLCISITFERLISDPCVTTDKKGLWKGYSTRGWRTFYDKWFKSCRYSKISQIFAKNRDFCRDFFFLPFTRFSYFCQNFSPIGAFFRKLEGGVIFDPPPGQNRIQNHPGQNRVKCHVIYEPGCPKINKNL